MDLKVPYKSLLTAAIGIVAGIGSYWISSRVQTSEKKPSHSGCFLSKDTTPVRLGTLDGKEISSDNLPMDLQNALLTANSEHYRRISEIVDEAAVRRMAAVAAGRPSDFPQLPPLKDLMGDSVKEEDVRKFFDENKNSFPNVSYDRVSVMLRRHLEQQRQSSFLQSSLSVLQKEQRLKINIPLPCGPKLKVSVPSTSFKTGKGNKNQLIFISDYHCSTCRYMINKFNRIVEKNMDKIQMIQVIVPNKKDGSSDYLVRGTFCAQKSGDEKKLKDFMNNAYISPVQYDSTGKVIEGNDPRASAIQVAKDSGLDMTFFESCLSSKEAEEFASKNIEYAKIINLEQFPEYYLNQKRIWLPPQLNLDDHIQQVIDENETSEKI